MTTMLKIRRNTFVSALAAIACLGAAASARAQLPTQQGEPVPRDVREMYDRGLKYIAAKQQADNGGWPGGYQGPGVTGLCLMAFLASGEDPNFGLYSTHVRKSVRNIIERRTRAPATSATACTTTASRCSPWPRPTAPSTSEPLWPDGQAAGRSVRSARR